VTSHCFPFRQIPHSTRLFLDYLDHTSSAHPFYPRSARFLEWAREEAALVRYPDDRRQRVAGILERQNKFFGASSKTFENISAFRSGALALVTGQQVGLFGGPVFSIYKALSAVKLSSEAQKLGIPCVPIFWLATEDHDLEEVSVAGIPNSEGTIDQQIATAKGKEDAPVGTVELGAQISELLATLRESLGASEFLSALEECYRPDETFGTAFAKFFARLFADYGVILLDGSDPELDEIAAPLYRQAIEQSSELNQALLDRDEELEAAGYHQQVRITQTSTPLFVIRDGVRTPLHAAGSDRFTMGEQEVSKSDLLNLASTSPESFSPSVLLRPVVQDYLLPTLTYVGGAAEVAYFAQVAVAYQALLGRITPVLSRFSATLIEPKAQALLEKYRLSFPDLFGGPESLRERIGTQLLGDNLQKSFENANAAVEKSMTAVREALAHLDKTLVESAQNAESKMLYQLTNLRSRAARAELRHSEVAERHARILSNFLYPDKTLQEREYAGIYFLAKHGRELLNHLLGVMHPDCVDHQLITL
jgi:bacillithiol biosynthesis cysteine-adding enzyme BshC